MLSLKAPQMKDGSKKSMYRYCHIHNNCIYTNMHEDEVSGYSFVTTGFYVKIVLSEHRVLELYCPSRFCQVP